MRARIILFIKLVSIVLVFSAGCKQESPIQHTLSSYYNTSSGVSAVTDEHVIVVRNPLGMITIFGEGTVDPLVRWYVYKTVQAESEVQAGELFPTITLTMQKSNDTIYVVLSSTMKDNNVFQSTIRLGIPSNMICRVEQVLGTTSISDLDTSIVVMNSSDVDVKRLRGSCGISSNEGNISVDIILPVNGKCLINVVKGNILLKTPTTTSASVYLMSKLGTVSVNGLSVTITEQQSAFISGTLGNGSGEIRAETDQGNITLQSL